MASIPGILRLEILAVAVAAAAGNIEEVEAIIVEKKALLKNSQDVYETERLFAELDSLEWL